MNWIIFGHHYRLNIVLCFNCDLFPASGFGNVLFFSKLILEYKGVSRKEALLSN